MFTRIIDSQEVRAQKAAQSSQSLGSSFVFRHSKERLEIKMLKETLRQQDEALRLQDDALRQQDEYYSQALAQQQGILQVR
jgi:hypothetical protein